jgi:hypothetical protein
MSFPVTKVQYGNEPCINHSYIKYTNLYRFRICPDHCSNVAQSTQNLSIYEEPYEAYINMCFYLALQYAHLQIVIVKSYNLLKSTNIYNKWDCFALIHSTSINKYFYPFDLDSPLLYLNTRAKECTLHMLICIFHYLI